MRGYCLLAAAWVLLLSNHPTLAQQQPSPPVAEGVRLDLSVEQTQLIVNVLGQAQCGALSVSTLALCQRVTDVIAEIRRQAKEQVR